MANNGKNGNSGKSSRIKKARTVSLITVCKEIGRDEETNESGKEDPYDVKWLDRLSEEKDKGADEYVPVYVGVVAVERGRTRDRIVGDSQNGWTGRSSNYLDRFCFPVRGEPLAFVIRRPRGENGGVYSGLVREIYDLPKDTFNVFLDGLAAGAKANKLKEIIGLLDNHPQVAAYPDLQGILKEEVVDELEKERGELEEGAREAGTKLLEFSGNGEGEGKVLMPEPLTHFSKCMVVRGTLDALEAGLSSLTYFLDRYSDLESWGNLAHLAKGKSVTSVIEMVGQEVGEADKRRINDLMERRNALFGLKLALERKFADSSNSLDEVDLSRLTYGRYDEVVEEVEEEAGSEEGEKVSE
jgi:hypothetical protein